MKESKADFSKYELRDMDCIEKYAKPSEEELLEILNPSNYSGTGHFINYISNEFEDDLLSLIYPIFNSPYPKDYIIKILNKVAPWEYKDKVDVKVGPDTYGETIRNGPMGTKEYMKDQTNGSSY